MTISRNLSVLGQYVSTSGIISQIVTLPAQTSNSGKYLTTNGTSASWATVTAGTSGSNVFTGDATGTGTNGTAALTLSTSGVTAGTYGSATSIPVIQVNSKGLVISASTTAITIPSSSISFTGDVTGSGTTGSSTTLTLSTSGVNAGTYGLATIIVDAKGRVTSATSGTAGSSGSNVFTGDVTGIGTSGTAALTLSTSGATAGTYTNATVVIDAKGRVTSATSGTAGSSGSNVFTGDVTGIGTSGTAALTLSTTGTTAGSYIYPDISVDTKGRVTSIQSNRVLTWRGDWNDSSTYNLKDIVKYNNSYYICTTANTNVNPYSPGIANSTWTYFIKQNLTWQGTWSASQPYYYINDIVNYNGSLYLCIQNHTGGFVDPTATGWWTLLVTNATSGSGSNVFIGDVTGIGTNGTAALTLSTSGAAAGTYTNATVVIDAKGRVTSATSGIAGSGTGGATVFTGDVTGTAGTNGTAALALSTSGAAAGTYTNATVVIDAKGRVTSATSGIAGSGTGGATVFTGDVTGTAGTNGTAALALSTSGVTAGTYGLATIVVDAKGRITSAASGVGGGTGGISTLYFRSSQVATAGQTSIIASYTVGFLQLYINGVLLNAADYTATTGSTITLAKPCRLNDIIEIITFNSFITSDSILSSFLLMGA